MTELELKQYLLAAFEKENETCEWKEFKNLKHSFASAKGSDIISYISAISNMDGGHLVLGIEDKTLNIIGIQEFHDYTLENIKYRIKERCTNISSENLSISEYKTTDTNKTVWVINIPKHLPRLPVYAHSTAWQRIGDSLTELTPERRETILSENIYNQPDWSSKIIENATISDLDKDAIILARQKFKEKHSNQSYFNEIDSWDNSTFLDKVKITINGRVTTTAIILLGKPESAHYLLPSVAQITWKLDTEEKAYQHFETPLLVNVSNILSYIRNVKYKFFPNNQLLSVEVNKYETRVILEAVNNCIAHQDYSFNSRIIITEQIDKLIFSNAGSFFEGNAEDYTMGNKTPEKYRNTWLTRAMVNLGMIDTMGYGIHMMNIEQRKRFFPLPDYSKSEPNKVVLQIYGHPINENYSKILIEKQDLQLTSVVLLDKIQKNIPITNEAIDLLRKQNLIEGRKPNYYISAPVANMIDQKANYIKNRSFDDDYFKDLIISYLKKYNKATRKEIEDLLFDKLSDVLKDEQKYNKIKNLLTSLRKEEKIINNGSDKKSEWILT